MTEEFDGVEWDERKSNLNAKQRGFGFDFAADVFNDGYIESESFDRGNGELRFLVIGRVDDLIITVVWTPRGTNRRIISARPSSRKERRIYRGHRQKKNL